MTYVLPMILGLALGCGGLPPDVARVQRLFERGAYEDAVSAADTSLETHPGHRVLWRVKVQARFGLGMADMAMADYRAWHAVRGSHDRTLLKRISLTTLWQGLRVPSAGVQVRAVQAVERLEVEKLARDVYDLMGNDADQVAAAAAVALLRSRPGAPQIAGQLLSSDEPEARAIAVEGIARKLGKRARGNLAFSWRDGDPRVRRAGVRGFAAMAEARDTDRLVRLAGTDPDPGVRAEALRGLTQGKRGPVSAVADTAVTDPDPEVRRAAVALLAATREYSSLERIARADDPLTAVMATAALRTAGKRADTGRLSASAVERGLADPAWIVRAGVVRALADVLPRAQAIAFARRLVTDADPRVQVAAAAALHDLGEPDADELLSAVCASESVAAREAAVRAHQERDLVTTGLASLLADESALVRVQAAEALLHAVD